MKRTLFSLWIGVGAIGWLAGCSSVHEQKSGAAMDWESGSLGDEDHDISPDHDFRTGN